MKKIFPLIIAAALLCTGCRSQSSTESTSDSTTAATQASTAANEELSPTDGTIVDDTSDIDVDDTTENRFLTGTYLLTSDDIHIGYMFGLEAEEPLAMFYTFDAGVEYEVTYKIVENTIEFNGENDSVIIDITGGDLSVFGFKTADGLEYRLSYFSESMPDEVLGEFHSNPRLCEIALDYYEKNNGTRPASCEAVNNADNTVTLHIFEDESTIIASYTVDRTSCAGTDDETAAEINLLA